MLEHFIVSINILLCGHIMFVKITCVVFPLFFTSLALVFVFLSPKTPTATQNVWRPHVTIGNHTKVELPIIFPLNPQQVSELHIQLLNESAVEFDPCKVQQDIVQCVLLSNCSHMEPPLYSFTEYEKKLLYVFIRHTVICQL